MLIIARKYISLALLSCAFIFSGSALAEADQQQLEINVSPFANNNDMIVAMNDESSDGFDEPSDSADNGPLLSNATAAVGEAAVSHDDEMSAAPQPQRGARRINNNFDYMARIPHTIPAQGEKVIIVDPHVHVWAAYDADGNLVRAGIASAGRDWCPDIQRPCHTKVGVYRVYSVGEPGCKSRTYPVPRGGAPMPYCMFFNNGQALHGAPDFEIGDANLSHGCVRMRTSDAQWLRYNFITVGTKVIIKPY